MKATKDEVKYFCSQTEKRVCSPCGCCLGSLWPRCSAGCVWKLHLGRWCWRALQHQLRVLGSGRQPSSGRRLGPSPLYRGTWAERGVSSDTPVLIIDLRSSAIQGAFRNVCFLSVINECTGTVMNIYTWSSTSPPGSSESLRRSCLSPGQSRPRPWPSTGKSQSISLLQVRKKPKVVCDENTTSVPELAKRQTAHKLGRQTVT